MKSWFNDSSSIFYQLVVKDINGMITYPQEIHLIITMENNIILLKYVSLKLTSLRTLKSFPKYISVTDGMGNFFSEHNTYHTITITDGKTYDEMILEYLKESNNLKKEGRNTIILADFDHDSGHEEFKLELNEIEGYYSVYYECQYNDFYQIENFLLSKDIMDFPCFQGLKNDLGEFVEKSMYESKYKFKERVEKEFYKSHKRTRQLKLIEKRKKYWGNDKKIDSFPKDIVELKVNSIYWGPSELG